jgi:uncharacterized protein YecT (DUF1311 family)
VWQDKLAFFPFSKVLSPMRIISAFVFAFALAAFAPRSLAVEIEVVRVPGTEHPMVFMRGPVERGDAERFIEIVDTMPSASIILSGPGGLMSEALEIGAEIRIRSFSTMVLPNEECASACGVIWLSGIRRYMADTSMIGFHAAYIIRNGVPYETGMGNAEVGSFMTHLGYSIEAIRFLTAAPPNGINWLTLDHARALGIDVYENRGFDVITPDQQPSISRLARQASLASAAIQNCGLLFDDGEKAALRPRIEQMFYHGHERFGGEAFGRAVFRDRDRLDHEVGNRGLQWCVQSAVAVVVEHLRGNPALLGPSFDCAQATTATELAVCSDPYIARLDVVMADVYALALRSEEDVSTRVRSSQRDWVRMRDHCGSDRDCLVSAYTARVIELFRLGS